MKPKSSRDRLDDVLEAVHIKEKPPAKRAAEAVAPGLEGLREALEEGAETTAGALDAFLKSIGLRERSVVDAAVSRYGAALHEIKVALGTEDRTTAEKLNAALDTASSRVKEAAHTAYGLLRHPLAHAQAAAQDHHAQAPFEAARETWDEVSARTLSALFHARDTAVDLTDAALKKAGLREERASLLHRARTGVDAATHSLLVSLGYDTPSAWERLRAYAVSGRKRFSGSSSSHGGIPGAYDAALRRLGLRDRDHGDDHHTTTLDRAASAYSSVLHSIRSALGAEDTGAGDRFAVFAENQRNRVDEILQSFSEEMPTAAMLPSSMTSPFPDRETIARASARASALLDTVKAETDAGLAALGPLRDKMTAESLREQFHAAWHDLKVSVGAESPSLLESLQYASGTKGGVGGALDGILKAVGIRDKSPIESAAEFYATAVHKLRVSLGSESAYPSEKLRQTFADATDRVHELAGFVSSVVPGGGAAAAVASSSSFPAAVRARYDTLSAHTIAALVRARDEADRALVASGLKAGAAKGPLADAKASIDAATHKVWVALGFEDPTLLERVEAIWARRSARGRKAAAPLAERVEAAVGAAGEQILHARSGGLLSGIKHRLFGG
jgi:hypothetical protein